MSAITKHRVCTSTLYPLVDKCVCKLNLVMPQYYYIWFCSVTIEQSHKSHTAFVPYPTTFNIQNKNAHIFVINGVLCDMGHVHCGIYENCLFIISSGSASCHHAPDLYLASNGHGRLPNKFGQNPTILILLAGGGERGQWGKLFGNATFAGRNRRVTAPSNKICCGETFSVFNWFKPNLVCLLGNRVNDHPPTLTKIGQL